MKTFGERSRLKCQRRANGPPTVSNRLDACPREIPITKAIGELKRAILLGRVD